MKKKHSSLEIGLFILEIPLFLLAQFKKVRQEQEILMGFAILVVALIVLSKVFRFYRQANETINTIWEISIVVILSGSTMYFFHWGLPTIAAWGIVAFGLTWNYAFLANKPEIK